MDAEEDKTFGGAGGRHGSYVKDRISKNALSGQITSYQLSLFSGCKSQSFTPWLFQQGLLHLSYINEVEMRKHCPMERDDNGETESSLDVGERL